MRKSKTYKELKSELDEIMQWFESDDVDVDKAIVKYEQGIKLVKELEAYLKTAENSVKKIRATIE